MTVLSSHRALSSIVPSRARPIAGVHQPCACIKVAFFVKKALSFFCFVLFFFGRGEGREDLRIQVHFRKFGKYRQSLKKKKNSPESYSRCQYFGVHLFNLFSFIIFFIVKYFKHEIENNSTFPCVPTPFINPVVFLHIYVNLVLNTLGSCTNCPDCFESCSPPPPI